MLPPLRERKVPDSSHITLWWQSEEHPDSWDSEQAAFSGQTQCDHWVLTAGGSRSFPSSYHLWQDPTHSDFSLAQSLAAYLPLRGDGGGKGDIPGSDSQLGAPQAPEWGVT